MADDRLVPDNHDVALLSNAMYVARMHKLEVQQMTP